MENTTNYKNIYAKLNEGRYLFKQTKLKGSGYNEYSKYSYIDMTDILPQITKIEHTLGYMTLISFDEDIATAKVINIDNPEEYILFTSPMSTANLKGCHEVQNLGAVETYLRRYLYMAIYEIVEQDVLDKGEKAVDEAENKPKQATSSKGQASEPSKKENAKQTAENTVMPVGKYKGEKLSNINPDYLEWYMKQPSADIKLKTAIEIVLKSQRADATTEVKAEAKTEQKGKFVEMDVGELTPEELDELPFTI